MKKALFVLLFASPVFAVNITSISTQGLFHAGVNFEVILDAPGWCQMKYGTTSGVYTNTAGVLPYVDNINTGAHTCAMNLGGLAPGTTYYVLPTAWPYADGNSTAHLCQTSGCGAVETVITTSAAPAVHPIPPAAPTTWSPVEPNTAGYTVVTLKADGSGHCAAAANVSAQTNWTGSVAINDSLQTIVNKVWYRTVIQWPQGLDCLVPNDGGPFGNGINLVKYSPDGGPTDWLVFETVQTGSGDFPPFGSRIGPEHASKLGILRAETPVMPNTIITSRRSLQGQLFECDSCGANHIWFRNLQVAGNTSTSIFPTNVTDPPMYGLWFRFIPACTNGINCQPDTLATSPNYIVIDRIYAASPPYPVRTIGCFSPGGLYWAIIGTYCSADTWTPAIFPVAAEYASASSSITVPYSYIRHQYNSSTRYGMPQVAGYFGTVTQTFNVPSVGAHATFTTDTSLSFSPGDLVEITVKEASGNERAEDLQRYAVGTVFSYNNGTRAMDFVTEASSFAGQPYSNWEINRPNKVTFSGANIGTYTGTVIAWVDNTNGLTVDYQTATGVTASCLYATGCRTITEATPTQWVSNPTTSFYIFSGSFNGAGAYTHSCSYASCYAFTPNSRWTPWSPLGLYVNSGRYGVYRNNFMAALGQTIYFDTTGNLTDLVLEKNFLSFPRSKMENSSTWDGSFQTYRNVFEPKELVRAIVLGNIFDGSGSEQNAGNPLYIAGSWSGPWSGGTTDWQVQSNVFRHISTGVQCNGGGAAQPPDPNQASRNRLVNNMWLDMDKEHYSSNWNQVQGPSFATGAFSISPGCADMEITSNTIGQAKGLGPAIMIMGASGNGPSVMGEGLKMSKNFVVSNVGQVYGPFDTSAGGATNDYGIGFTNFPANPFVLGAHTGTWAQRFDSAFLRVPTGGSVTPSWQSGLNVVIPGQSGTTGTWVDMPQTGATNSVDWFNSNWIDSSTHIAQGNTLATRLTAAGWSSSMNLSSGKILDYRITASSLQAGDSGANVDQVIADTGIVTNISTLLGSTFIGFSYIAPDSRACNVDTSPNGTTWTRFTDSGGARARTLTATGLTAATAYQYRLLCYFDQAAAYEFTPDQITSGTVTTLANASVTVFTGFTLPAGATQALVTLTPLTGSPSSATCSTSPCSITAPNGTYNRTIQPQTSGAVSVGQPRTSTITIAGVSTGTLFDSATGLFDSATGLFDSH